MCGWKVFRAISNYKCYPTYKLKKTTLKPNLASYPLENLVLSKNNFYLFVLITQHIKYSTIYKRG